MKLASWTCVLCVCTVLFPAAIAEESAARPMTVEDLWAMERVGGPSLSPDGRLVAFTVSTYDFDENEGNGEIWLVPTDGSEPPRRLTWNKGPDGSPEFSPDGRRLAFVSKRGEDPPQLYILPLDGGEAERVTELPIGVSSPRWFPDGRRIAFLASTWPDLNDDFEAVKERVKERKEDKVKAKVTENRIFRYWDHYITDGKVSHVFVLDLESREVRDLLPGWERIMGFREVSWDLSPDGEEIAFAANATDPPYPKLNFDVFLLPTSGEGEPRAITAANPAWDSGPRYTPDGRFILFGRGRRPEIHPDYTRLARYDRSDGSIVGLTDDWDGQPSSWVATPDGETVLFHAQEGGQVHLWAMPVAGGAPRVIARGGRTGGAEPTPSGEIVLSRQSITAPAELLVSTADGTSVRALTAFNAERLAALDLGSVEDLTFEGADGDAVQMSSLTRLVMVRHGETVGQSSVRYHGATNVALSDQGRAQVRAATRHLPRAAIDEWVSSPLDRAWESARILARGRPIRLDDDFREGSFGEWEGMTAEEIEASNPVLYRDWRERRPGFEYPGGEKRADREVRIGQGLARLLASGARLVVLVAHKGVIREISDRLAGDRLRDDQPPLGGVVQLTRRADGKWYVGRRSIPAMDESTGTSI